MQIFHKSFLGLMEQSKDGEWVKVEDFTAEINSLHSKLERQQLKLKFEGNKAEKAEENVKKLKEDLVFFKSLLSAIIPSYIFTLILIFWS